jgi:cyclase
MSRAVNIPVIASGGCGELSHVSDAFEKGEADAALMASIFHYKEYTVKDVKEYLLEKGVEVRI